MALNVKISVISSLSFARNFASRQNPHQALFVQILKHQQKNALVVFFVKRDIIDSWRENGPRKTKRS
jgi:hypothetical protein